jgi:16S rRNA (uracil1498-N3)-methyltransferase
MAERLRVHVPELAFGERELDAETSKYVARVHRLDIGDRFQAFDPEARLESDAEIVSIGQRVRVRLSEPRPATRISALAVTLLFAFGKADKVDRVVRDASALGARAVIVVETERSVVRLEQPERVESRRRRWRTIAAEAARQSERGDLPELGGPLALSEALASLRAPRKLLLDPRASLPLSAALDGWQAEEPLAVLIGPEGGFSEAELELAERHGFQRVRFGMFVLRTETAATALLGALVALAD